jgi:urease accessory protein
MLNRRLIPSLSALVALLLLPAATLAHTSPIHGNGWLAGLTHPIGGMDHLLAMVAVGLWAAQLGGRARWGVPSAFVAVMLAGAGLGLAGLTLPFIEGGILLSVLLLGVVLAAAWRLPVVASTGLVGVFGLFHGFAHGAEMPAALSSLAYSAGFTTTTLLLHGAGIAAGLALQQFKVPSVQRLAGGAIIAASLYLIIA